MKSAVVTGAAGGLGIAIAAHASANGYRVCLLDLDLDKLRTVAGNIPNSILCHGDACNEESIEAAIRQLGAIPDLLVNNVGRVVFGQLVEQTSAAFRSVIETNIMGTVVPSLVIGRRMVERGAGNIVNISSIGGIAAAPNTGAYPASKAAIIKLTEQMAVEWGPSGVRVNCVAPGFIDAGMSEAVYANPDVRRLRSSAVPLGRLGTAADVAGAVMFCASDAAAYINGQTLVVDGGVTFSLLAQLPNKIHPSK